MQLPRTALALASASAAWLTSAAAPVPQTPSFRPDLRSMVPVGASAAVALGDLDGDGDLDACTGRSVWWNVGGGVFAGDAPLVLPGPPGLVRAVALGDLDGDGDADIVVAHKGPPNRLFRNEGGGVFTDITGSHFPSHAERTESVVLGDVDADGDLDVIFGNAGPSGERNRLYRNDGSAGFTNATAGNLPPGGGVAFGVALGDVDGDGDLDLMIANASASSGRRNELFLNDGSGTFNEVTAGRMPNTSNASQALALGDVDGDGDLDALIGNVGAAELYWNDGGGSFDLAPAASLPALAGQTSSVALGDVNRDGTLDALLGRQAADALWLGDGTGAFVDLGGLEAAVVPTPVVALGDVDGDGDLDGVAARFQQDGLYLGDGDGTFVDVLIETLPVHPNQTSAVAAADVNGDGDLDLFLGAGGQNRLYLGDGDGGFRDATETHLPAAPDSTEAVLLFDADSDGDVDALIGNCGANRLLSNDGAGHFTDVSHGRLPLTFDDTFGLGCGDVDGDGDLDVWAANGFSDGGGGDGQDRLYVNDGSGTFLAPGANLPTEVKDGRGVDLADVDGDGDLDALVANAFDPSRLYLNDGTGVFTDVSPTHIPLDFGDTRAAFLGDLDGDGDVDALLAFHSGQNLIYHGDGGGVFVDATAGSLPSDSDRTQSLAVLDLEGDGDLDLVFGNVVDESRLLVNDGTGVFSEGLFSDQALAWHGALAWGDVDGDGDPDVLGGSTSQDRLYLNTSIQLAHRGLPRAGKSSLFELHFATPGAPWVLTGRPRGVGPGGAPPFAPAGLRRIASGLLDAEGRARVAVPFGPFTAGTTWIFRASLGTQGARSNRELITLTGF